MRELVTINTDRINARFNYEIYEHFKIVKVQEVLVRLRYEGSCMQFGMLCLWRQSTVNTRAGRFGACWRYGCNSFRIALIGYWKEHLCLRREKWQEDGENCVMRSFTICAQNITLFWWLNERECSGPVKWHAWGRREMHTTWYLKEWKHLTDLGVDGSYIIKVYFK